MPFQCNICDRVFRTSGHRRSHILSTHKNKNPRSLLKNSLEPTKLPEIQLQEPMLITESGIIPISRKAKAFLPGDTVCLERPYKCLVCSLAFRKSSHLQQHTRRHTGERPFSCNKCEKSFLTNGILKIHLQAHHEGLKPYKCDSCGNTFSTNGSLKRHMGTHSDVRQYMCPYCHKTFKSSVNTRKHMKIHATELAMQQVKDSEVQVESEAQLVLAPKHFTAPDFTQAFSDQPFHVDNTEDNDVENTFSSNSLVHSLVSDDINNSNMLSSKPPLITHTLHADASGVITLEQRGQNTLTQENIREIERTLNEQIFGNCGREDEPADNQANESDLESTTTEDLARTLASEPQELNSAASAQIINCKTGQNGNLYETLFDFSSIGLQVEGDVTALDESTLTTHMSSILEVQETADCNDHENIDIPIENQLEEEQQQEEIEYVEVSEEVVPKQPSPRKYICQICNRGFKKVSHVKAHERTHIKLKLYQCEQCQKKVSTASALRVHMKTHSVAEKEFACQACGMAFNTNWSLIRHWEVHSNKKPFNCSFCSSKFRTALDLRRHIKLHEPREEEGRVVIKDAAAAPPIRGRRRASIIRLTAEETENLAKQSVQEASSVSEEVLIASAAEANRISELRDPDQQYNLEPLHPNQCKYCPKSFRKPSDLVRHIRIHTGERPYQCNCCNKCFTVKSTLDSHLKTHTGYKSFNCHVCSCVFSTKGSLKVHMRLHTGAKPFKCPLCDQKFRTSGHRKAHLMIHLRNTNKKQDTTSLSHRVSTRRPHRIKEDVDAITTEANTEDLVPYQVDADSFNIMTQEENIDTTNGNFHLQLSSNMQIGENEPNMTGTLLATPPLQIDEQLLQQLQSSNIIFQTSTSDANGISVFNTGDLNGNMRYEIHTDEHGQIFNIQPIQDDVSGENIMFNLNEEELNMAVEEQEQQESQNQTVIANKLTRYRATDSHKSGQSLVSSNNSAKKRKKAQEVDEDFLLFYDCEVCWKRFAKPSQLERHKLTHKPHRGNLKTNLKGNHHLSKDEQIMETTRSNKIIFQEKDSSSSLNMDTDVNVKTLDLDMVGDLFPQINSDDT